MRKLTIMLVDACLLAVPAAAEFHTLRIMPPPGMHYDTDTIRKFCDVWEKYGSGLIAFHGQSGDIMFQG